MRTLFLIFTVLCVSLSHCQIPTFRFNYSVFLNKHDDITDSMFREYMQNAEYKSEFVPFSLFVDENGMKFESYKSPNISDEDYLSILDISDIDGIYYRKNNSDLFYREIIYSYFGKDNIATKKIITDWKITSDEKFINGNKCFKATCTLKEDLGDGELNVLYPVTAWFCPEIKYPYGPKGIGGLPGLIVELELRLVTFKLVSVEPKTLNVDISIPTNKEIITEDEFHNIIEKDRKKYTKN